MVRIMP